MVDGPSETYRHVGNAVDGDNETVDGRIHLVDGPSETYRHAGNLVDDDTKTVDDRILTKDGISNAVDSQIWKMMSQKSKDEPFLRNINPIQTKDG